MEDVVLHKITAALRAAGGGFAAKMLFPLLSHLLFFFSTVPKGKDRKHRLAQIPSHVAAFIRLSRNTLSVWAAPCLLSTAHFFPLYLCPLY